MKTENNDKLLISNTEEKIFQCSNRQLITFTKFLDMHEKSIVASVKLPHGVKRIFCGMTESDERMIACFVPDYVEAENAAELYEYWKDDEDECPVRILNTEKDKFSRALSHRDYLGALMGLGINRDVVGDIAVSENGCRIAVLKSMAEYIRENLTKAGRGTLKIEIEMPSGSDISAADNGEEFSFTVSGARLDSIVKNGFGVSRDAACEAIVHGLVFMNNVECLKPGKRIEAGDKISFRHNGRIIIDDCSGISKKGRIIVKTRKYR